MNEKITQYIQLKIKVREMEAAIKSLEGEIKNEITEKVECEGYILSKKLRTTYVMKPWVDLQAIKARYPGICTTICWIDPTKIDVEIVKAQFPEAYYENITVEAKTLYTVAENPKSLVDEKIVTYLEVKKWKPTTPDVDF